MSDADDVEREAIGAECFDRFFIREELEFLTSHEDLEHAIAGNDVGQFFPRRTASLDHSIQKTRAPVSNEIASQASSDSRWSGRNRGFNSLRFYAFAVPKQLCWLREITDDRFADSRKVEAR